MKKLRIIVGGNIGIFPTGGATWDYIQYPIGLQQMGHDVYYIEDTMRYPLYQKNRKQWNDATDCIKYLKDVMLNFGFADKWAYRDIASGQTFGMSEEKIHELCRSTDIFINISCSTVMRDEYKSIPVRVLIDTDPMFTQIQYAMEVNGEFIIRKSSTRDMIENHNYLFTFGENINKENCKIPRLDFDWLTTRQPICLDQWENQSICRNDVFTSVMNWSEKKKLIYNNEEWGQKDSEFKRFKELPMLSKDTQFEMVMNFPRLKESGHIKKEFENIGWKFRDPEETVSNVNDYRSYLLQSAAEFSIAKETYVKSHSGWFSCRSACYLAAAKPVITQDTGWSENIPTGKGLFSFTDVPSALDAIKAVKSDMRLHSRAASEIAREYFDSKIVLADMLEKLN